MKKPVKAVVEYWVKHYVDDQSRICSLCGNTGEIDTRNARSRAGVRTGRLNWCICPNGQVAREAAKGNLPTCYTCESSAVH